MKLLLSAMIITLGLSTLVWAHPPSDVQLQFDKEQNLLHVQARHVTAETKEHYIRLITVTVNQNEPKIFRYNFQKQPSMIDVLLPVEAKPGDVIQVNLRCLKGGTVDATLEIPQDDKKQDGQDVPPQAKTSQPVAP